MKIVLILTALMSLITAIPTNGTLLSKEKAGMACNDFSALRNLSSSTIDLDKTIIKWNATREGVLEIAWKFSNLPFEIDDYANLTWNCPPLNDTEALQLQILEILLIADTQSMLRTVVEAKEKFEALGLGRDVAQSLTKQSLACEKLLNGLMIREPDISKRSVFEVRELKVFFDKIIKDYSEA